MNAQLAEAFHIYELTTQIRDALLASLENSDLGFELPGSPMLGLLIAEYAGVQNSYIGSFKTFKQDWTLETDVALSVSVQKLKDRFKQLDEELSAALETVSDDDFKNKLIDRGGYGMSAGAQLHTLREALLIMLAKVSVYLRAMGKPLGKQYQDWIG